MTFKEFTDRTGFIPTVHYYSKHIEPEYMSSELDKDQFCRQWKKNGGIQTAYDHIKSELALSIAEANNLHQDVNKYRELLQEVKGKLDDERQEAKILQQTYDTLNDTHFSLVDFLIEQAENPDAAAIRDKAIELVGKKQYLRSKLEMGMELNEADKALLLEML